VVGVALAAILALRAGWAFLEDVWQSIAICLCGAVYIVFLIAVIEYSDSCSKIGYERGKYAYNSHQ